jgi:ElaB/YqjD/DUF883 family membrane-anchored ribosome-binding protein
VNSTSSKADSRDSDFASAKGAAGETLSRTQEGIANAASTLEDDASIDVENLRRDLNSLRETVSRFVSQAGEVSSSIAGQVGDAASSLAGSGADMASVAKEQAKTFASELESIGRRNPLGSMAAAFMVGVLIGLIGRGRSS